jgi:hypothetical protein
MDFGQIKKFASDACTVIANYQEMVKSLMEKQASAPEVVSIDDAKLQKAANAVYEMYDRPAKVSVDSIVDFWKSNPSAMADTITKIASERQAKASIEGSNIGTAMPKKASAESSESADAAFWSRYE